MPNVQQEHISLESHTLCAVDICLSSLTRPGGEWLPNYDVALICLFAYERLSKISDRIHAIHPQPQSPNMEFPGLRPRAWHPEPSFLIPDGVGSRESSRVKMFINTQGPKRKEPTADEPAGEDVGSLLFSWCEWITTLILRDLEVSSAISRDSIYSAGQRRGESTIKINFFMFIFGFSEINKSSINFIFY